MNKTRLLSFIFLFTMITLVHNINAQPFSFGQTQVGSGQLCDIVYPKYFYVPQSMDFNLSIKVFDKFQGLELTDTQIDCEIHITNPMGVHIIDDASFSQADDDLEIYLNSSIFSSLGFHSYLIQCNGTITDETASPDEDYNGGCFADGLFQVTYSGNQTPEDFTTAVFILLCFVMFVGTALVLLNGLKKGTQREMDLEDVVKSFIAFGVFILFYWFTWNYLGDAFIVGLLEDTLWVVGFLAIFVSPIFFFISYLDRLRSASQ